ncbi:Fe-S cluster assembly protein SufD [Pseudactinotalea suaedae]|uniref:Fe-S cluster assembly protein SufD n=1 Tax=Pseudactinotalea suaedae TaxID=1524924 RepID=UPI0012E20231|nr:Fe-S cluster assembly protein SufD [Pseudactinotalea suaedae]
MTAEATQPTTTSTDHSRATADEAHSHGPQPAAPGASYADRFASADPAAFEVPTGREEEWRFTPLRRLRGLLEDAPLGAGGIRVDIQATEGFTAEQRPVEASDRGASGYVPIDRVSARVWAATAVATVIDVPAEAEIAEPIVITVTGEGGQTATAGHTLIRVGPHARATVVTFFEGSATLAENVEIVVGDGASLTVVTYQDWARDAVHHSNAHAVIGRDAELKHVSVSFGGDLVRHDTTAVYDGPGGSVELLGLYFADAGQHIEHRLFVDHNEPQTRSNVLYKGALQGQDAHSVWIGNVLIRQEAEGIDTYELNRNLLLTDGARADSVPNLEIETGEIEGAGHASATGRFDDEQLFYLRSRGIPEAAARRLVLRGFFADMINKIGVPVVAERMLAAIEVELEVAMAGELESESA